MLQKGGLSPLHLAAGTPGEEGILITEYLLNALSDPDARATVDNSYLDPDDDFERDDEWDCKGCEDAPLGRTPLHIACSREDDYEVRLDYIGNLIKCVILLTVLTLLIV